MRSDWDNRVRGELPAERKRHDIECDTTYESQIVEVLRDEDERL